MSINSKVKVIEQNSQKVLFTCSIEELDSAVSFASEMEKMGIDVVVDAPTITETLCDTLGIQFNEKEEFEQSVIAEIEDHDGSCCATPAKLNQ